MPNANGYLTLTDLRRFVREMQGQPGDLEIGVTDHYGDFWPMSGEPELQSCKAQYGRGPKKDCIIFDRIDVGPEPD